MSQSVNFVVYDSQGEIINTGAMPIAVLNAQTFGGTVKHEIADPSRHYYNPSNGVRQNKTNWSLTVPTTVQKGQSNTITVNSIPSGTVLYIDGKSVAVINDGSLVLSFEHATHYKIMFSHFKYFDKEYTVAVTP